MFDNFYYTDDIFSNGLYLKGSTRFTADLSIEEKRPCSTCLNYLGKNKCSSLKGKILNPDTPCCSWYKPKHIKRYITKRCSVCGKVKSINKFYKDKSVPDGRQYKCCMCALEYGKEYQRNNKKLREYMGVWSE